MKVVIDEDLPRALTKLLREKGYEVFDVRDVGLRGASDEEVFRFAQEKGAALFTADLGFANIVKFPPNTHQGIIILRFPNEVSVHTMLEMLDSMIDEISEKELAGSIVVFSPHKIRIRKSQK